MSRETEPALPYSGMSGQIAHYRLGGYIGRGAMAVVYLAQDQRTGGNVALKVVAPELAGDAAFRSRFLTDSRMAAAIGHPHIIPIYEADEAAGNLYLAMHYVAGGDARSLLNRHGPLPVDWAWTVVAAVASALDAAHAHGLLHGDVRPANMLLETGGQANGAVQPATADGPGHVYLSDFGMSRSSPSSEIIAAGQVEPLDYAAPEQIERQDLDGRADQYSLACSGYELLCGTAPFGQDQGLTLMYAQLYAPPPSASARRPDLPSAVDAVLATAMAKNPADRFPTCGQFAEALRAALGSSDYGNPPAPAGYANPDPTAGYANPEAPAAYTGPEAPAAYAGPEAAAVAAAAAAAGPAAPVPDTWPGPMVQDDWTGYGQQGPAGQGYLPPGDTLAGAPTIAGPPMQPGAPTMYGPPAQTGAPAQSGAPTMYGPGWQQPPLPPPPGAPSAPGPDFFSKLRVAYPRSGRLPSGKRLVLVVAVIAVVVVGIVAGIALSGGSSPSTPAASSHAASPAPSTAPSSGTLASRQATAVSTLLSSSAAARRSLEGAVADVRGCSSLASATSQIQTVASQRNAEYRQAKALSMGGLPNGTVVKSDLLSALRASLDADRDYLTWARRELHSGCRPAGQSPAYNAAVGEDSQAGSAKATFVQAWNPVAAKYGDPQESASDI